MDFVVDYPQLATRAVVTTPTAFAAVFSCAHITADVLRLKARYVVEFFVPAIGRSVGDGVGLGVALPLVRVRIDASAVDQIVIDPLLYVGISPFVFAIAPRLN